MNINSTGMSCGVKEITGVGIFNPKTAGETFLKNLRKYVNYEYGRRERVGDGGGTKNGQIAFIFSDRIRKTNTGGKALAEFIEEQKVGKITSLGEFTNYNTGRVIGVWSFYVHKTFIKEAIKGRSIRTNPFRSVNDWY